MQRHAAVLGHQAQLNVRKALLQARQARRQPFAQERRNRTHPQRPADHPRVQPAQFRIDAAVGLVDRNGQSLAFGAQLHAPGTPVKQAKTQALFQLADLLADRPRRDVQFFGATGERQVPRGTGKHVQPDVSLGVQLTAHRLVLLKAVLGSFVGHVGPSEAVSPTLRLSYKNGSDSSSIACIGFSMAISVFDLFKVGIGPSSSHTVGPMRAAATFAQALVDQDLLDDVRRVEIRLYGSLSATGVGHATDRACVMGLMGEWPDSIDPTTIDSRIQHLRETGELSLAGQTTIAFDWQRDLLLLDESLPYHPNAMSLTAFGETGELFRANVLLGRRRFHHRSGRSRVRHRADQRCGAAVRFFQRRRTAQAVQPAWPAGFRADDGQRTGLAQ